MVPDSVAPLRFAPERSAPVRSVSLKSAPLRSALARRAPSKSRYARSMPLRFWPPKSSFSGLPSTARSRSTSVLVKGGTAPPASGLPIFMIILPRHSRSPRISAMSIKLSRNSIPHIISAACHLSYRNCRRFLCTDHRSPLPSPMTNWPNSNSSRLSRGFSLLNNVLVQGAWALDQDRTARVYLSTAGWGKIATDRDNIFYNLLLQLLLEREMKALLRHCPLQADSRLNSP